MKKFNLILLAIAATFLMVSCRGKQGPMGPQGPQGNANVVSSTLTVQSSDWYFDNNTSWRVDIDYDAINMDIFEDGAVFVYMKEGNTWRQIPLTFYYSLTNEDGSESFYSSSLEVSYYLNGVSIFWTENDFYDGYRPDTRDFKIVAIAASLYNSRKDIDYSNYEAVEKAFMLDR